MQDRYFKFIAAIIVLGLVLAFFSSTSAQTHTTASADKSLAVRGL